MENPKFMSYNNMGGHATTTTTITQQKVDKYNFTRMVRIDEDELECLRKLGEDTHNKMEKNILKFDEDELECLCRLSQDTHQKMEKNMVRLDEDELECLRKLEGNSSTLKSNSIKVLKVASGKLETKKSEDINESAEKFIQSFRQQLVLQRLESIENADKMLARGL